MRTRDFAGFSGLLLFFAATGCTSGGTLNPEPQVGQTAPGDRRTWVRTNHIGNSPFFQTNYHEGEISIAYDVVEQQAYVATIQSITQATTFPCITAKGIALYQSQNGGEGWSEITDARFNHLTQSDSALRRWITDPWLATAPGTGSNRRLYLGVIDTSSVADCNAAKPASLDTDRVMLYWRENGVWGEVEVSRPGNSEKTTGGGMDHPRIAADSSSGRVVVTYSNAAVDSGISVRPNSNPDQVVTLERQPDGSMAIANRMDIPIPAGQPAQRNWPHPEFDDQGKLYLQVRHQLNLPNGIGSRFAAVVHRYAWNSTSRSWTLEASGGPVAPFLFDDLPMEDIDFDGDNVLSEIEKGNTLDMDRTPSMVLTKAGGVPYVVLGYEVDNFSVEVASAPADGTLANTQWHRLTTPIPNATHPIVSADANTNSIDVLFLGYENLSAGGNIGFDTRLRPTTVRYQTSTLGTATQKMIGDLVPVTDRALRRKDIPGRGPTVNTGKHKFFGEYMGLKNIGDRTLVAVPELPQWIGDPTYPPSARTNSDLGIGYVQTTNSSALTLASPDAVWECSCSCGLPSTVKKVACVSASAANTADACAMVCRGGVCGAAQSCVEGDGSACSVASPSNGRIRIGEACSVAKGPVIGAAPSNFADQYFTGTGSAHIAASGVDATTSLRGAVSVSTTAAVPGTGVGVEISRLQLAPSSFGVGGPLGATVRSIVVEHTQRLIGTFIDSTRFEVPTGAAELYLKMDEDPDGPAWLTGDTTVRKVRISNSAPITGVLNPTSHKIDLHIVASGSGTSIDATFGGQLDVLPTDSDGDAIYDAIDNCPTVFNPDQSDNPPVFGPVQTVVVRSCTPDDTITLTPPNVTDACTPNEITLEAVVTAVDGRTLNPGVFLKNFQGKPPSEGRLTVQWTATDGNNKSAVVNQTVNLVAQPTLFGNGSLKIGNGVKVLTNSNAPATVANAGADIAQVGVGALTGDVISRGNVFIQSNALVDGFVTTGGVLDKQAGARVTGTVAEHVSPAFLPFLLKTTPVFPSYSRSIDVPLGATQGIVPGSYGNVAIRQNATLVLSPGDYYFDSLVASEPTGIIRLQRATGAIRVFVHRALFVRGAFVSSNGSFDGFTMAYYGTDQAFIESSFTGILASPNAKVVLGGSTGHAGLFFGKEIEVYPNLTVRHIPFGCVPGVVQPGP